MRRRDTYVSDVGEVVVVAGTIVTKAAGWIIRLGELHRPRPLLLSGGDALGDSLANDLLRLARLAVDDEDESVDLFVKLADNEPTVGGIECSSVVLETWRIEGDVIGPYVEPICKAPDEIDDLRVLLGSMAKPIEISGNTLINRSLRR